MRTWVKVTLGGVIACLLALSLLAGTGAYYFFRHLQTSTIGEAPAQPEFESVRKKFGGRPPLVEVVNPRTGDIRVQPAKHPDGLRASTVYVLSWDAENNQLLRTDLPLWLMRFSSINVLSHLGLAPARYRLTAEDIASFGPGIIVEYREGGSKRGRFWVASASRAAINDCLCSTLSF